MGWATDANKTIYEGEGFAEIIAFDLATGSLATLNNIDPAGIICFNAVVSTASEAGIADVASTEKITKVYDNGVTGEIEKRTTTVDLRTGEEVAASGSSAVDTITFNTTIADKATRDKLIAIKDKVVANIS